MNETTPQQAVKNRILELCVHAFNQKGYKGLSMDMVARELKISKKTIYKYFSGKEEILEQALRRQLDQVETKVKNTLKASRGIPGFFAVARLYREFSGAFSQQLISEIRQDLPHLEEWLLLTEKQVFRKEFSKLAKELRTEKVIDYPVNTREFTNGFFHVLNGLNAMPLEDAEVMIGILIVGLQNSIGSGKSKKVKKGKKKKK